MIHPCLATPCTLQCKQSSDIIGGAVNKLPVPQFGRVTVPLWRIFPCLDQRCPIGSATRGIWPFTHDLAETGNEDLGLCFAFAESNLFGACEDLSKLVISCPTTSGDGVSCRIRERTVIAKCGHFIKPTNYLQRYHSITSTTRTTSPPAYKST